MLITEQLTLTVVKSLEKLGHTAARQLTFEQPTQVSFGDLSTNAAMTTFKDLSSELKSQYPHPRAWAAALVTQLSQDIQADSSLNTKVQKVDIAGPGFINFSLTDTYWTEVIKQAATPNTQLIPQSGQGHQAVVEYSSPNIAKPFTIGHLRSTIIGDAVARLLSATGWQVFRDNHLGDWGTQFGKQIYAIKHLGQGSEAANIAAIEAAENPVKVLVDLYVEFHAKAESQPELEDAGREWFQKLEAGDPEARALWQKCIAWSLKEFKKTYARLGVTFTENPDNDHMGYGESFFEDKMAETITELEKMQINGAPLIQESQGAKLVFFPDEKYPPLMIIKQDGATLYATRDLATDRWRRQHYGQDITIINEVGAEQSLYFQQLFEVERLAGWFSEGQRVHVKHGMYRFKDRKMSTRKGNVIWLSEVLDEAEKRAYAMSENEKDGRAVVEQPIPELASKIGIGALKWNDLKRSSHLDITFDWDEILNLKGNSGPYLQYTYVRCHSILKKADADGVLHEGARTLDTTTGLNEEEKAVARALAHFGEVVALAASEYAPHHLCTYLYELAQHFNAFYNQHSVLGETVNPEVKQFRIQLTQAVARVISEGLAILGIETVEMM